MSTFLNKPACRLFTLIIILFMGCSGGTDLQATADDVPNKIRDLIDSKKATVIGREAVTDLNLDIGVVKRAIKQLEQPHADLPRAFTSADLALIQEGLQARKSNTIDSLVLKSFDEDDLTKLKTLAPNALEHLQKSSAALATLDERKAKLDERMNALKTQAEMDETVESAIANVGSLADEDDAEASQKKLGIAMKKASRNARSVDEMIDLQTKALGDHLDKIAEEISAESDRRWNEVHVATHSFVWSRLTEDEKRSVGELNFGYITDTQKQFADFFMAQSQPLVVEEEPKLPTSHELRIAFANQINTEINSHNNSLSRASRAAVGGVMDMSGIDADVFAERSATEQIELFVEIHGAKLARPLAELCFDREERIERRAVKLLKSLKEAGAKELAAEGLSASDAQLFRFAILKTYDKHEVTITSDELWEEMLGETRFIDIALKILADRRDEIQLSSPQMEFVRNGIGSNDMIRCQNCLAIARHAVTLDDQTLDAIERKSGSRDYLAQRALELLAKHGRGQKIRAQLIEQLAQERNNSGYGRRETEQDAVRLVGKILDLDPQPAELEPLVKRLAAPGEGHKTREALAKLFKSAGGDSVAPIASLLSKNPPMDQRIELIESLGKIKIASPAVLDELTRALQRSDSKERQAAANALRLMGTDARAALEKLLTASQDPKTGNDAMRAVAAILEDPDVADLRKIVPYLRSKNDYTRGDAARIIISAGSKAKPLLPDVLALSRTGSMTLAARMLGSIGEATPEVVARLIEMTRERSSFVRQPAITSLGQLGPGAKSAVPTLADIVANQRDNKERYLAIWSLIQINQNTPTVIKSLKKIYAKRGPREYKRFTAVALIHFGEPAGTYERDLHYLLENSVSKVGVPFANLAAEQMLKLDPDNRLAKDRLERNQRNKEMEDKLQSNRW